MKQAKKLFHRDRLLQATEFDVRNTGAVRLSKEDQILCDIPAVSVEMACECWTNHDQISDYFARVERPLGCGSMLVWALFDEMELGLLFNHGGVGSSIFGCARVEDR